MSSHALLQGIFPTQGSNLGVSHCRQFLYPLSQQGNPTYIYTYAFFLKLCMYLFIFGCTGSSLLHAVCILSLQSISQPLLLAGSRLQAHQLRHVDFVAPHHAESSQTRVWEPVSPTLAGRFLTTEPPGKSCKFFFRFFPLILTKYCVYFPVLYSRSLLITYFICSVYMSTPTS